MLIQVLIWRKAAIVFSIMDVPSYISTNSVEDFPILYIFANIYLLTFLNFFYWI